MAKTTGVRRRCTKACTPGCRKHRFEFSLELPPGADGKRRQITRAGYRTADEAAEARDEVRRAHRSGTLTSDPKRRQETVATFLERWLEVKVSSGSLRPSTALSYRGHLDRALVPHLGGIRVRDLRRDHIEAMLEAVRKATANNVRPVGPATQRRILATLRSAIRDAVAAGELPHDHTAHVRLADGKRPKGHWWGPGAFWSFVAGLEDHAAEHSGSSSERMLPIVLVTTGTGLRLGEVCGLRWEDVDTTAGVLVVRQQAQQVGRTVAYVKPKTRSGEDRVVPLAGWVPETLEAHRKRQIAQRLAFGPDYADTGLVFTSEDGTALLPHSVSKAFTRLVKAAPCTCGHSVSGHTDAGPCEGRDCTCRAPVALPGLTFHGLRHIAATALLRAEVPMPVVSRILGHSNINITVDTYGHVAVDPQITAQVGAALGAFGRRAMS
jgi:integrase